MADLTFGTAPIGGGKSLWGTMHICKELERTDRLIVTNIPIILHMATTPERVATLFELLSDTAPKSQRHLYWSLQEYCQAFVKRPINIAERVIWLNEEQSREFFLYIPRGGIETDLEKWRNESDPEKTCYGYKLNKRDHVQKKWLGDFSPLGHGGAFEGRGVYYVIDEFHKLFGSRDWQSTGPQLEDFMSEIRKINGDLLMLTQHPEKVDKNCRRNATEWFQFQNMSKKTLLMGVSLQKRFRFHHYEQAEMPSGNDKPTRSGFYRIDSKRRYEFLYRTMQGSSIKGGGDGVVTEDNQRKGYSPWVWSVGACLLLCAVYFLPRMIEKSVKMGVGGVLGSVQTGASAGFSESVKFSSATNPVAQPLPVGIMPSGSSPGIHFRAAPQTPQPPDENLFPADLKCTGIVISGTNVVLMFNNGWMARSEYGEVQAYGRKFVKAFGFDKPIPFAPTFH